MAPVAIVVEATITNLYPIFSSPPGGGVAEVLLIAILILGRYVSTKIGNMIDTRESIEEAQTFAKRNASSF